MRRPWHSGPSCGSAGNPASPYRQSRTTMLLGMAQGQRQRRKGCPAESPQRTAGRVHAKLHSVEELVVALFGPRKER